MDENKSKVDWERVEIDYRAGMSTLRELSDLHHVSHVAIAKRAKKFGWVKDLTEKINQKADELVNKALVNEKVTNTEKLLTEAAAVETIAKTLADVKLSHRKDIAKSRGLALKLLGELEQTTDNSELFSNLGELMRSENAQGSDKLNDIYNKVISMPTRIKGMKELSETMRILISLEREAYGIDKPNEVDKEKGAAPLFDATKLSTSALREIVMASKDAESL